ncbi:PadR family transcriptional regulator [Lacticaseibacillus saniviri]|uniref:Transcription regulator PadR N-terminal domain-containing protein n=2 Tax=Lacticaseibacillus saniviri TaxID=931533 RepID=A0A0R2MQY4_9LACO|nr:PadR family transcriptional regulator [Lacticaseibacillus saniviri]KRO16021.1 hypothetical protein IV56_GL002020 [Lacticaseibacillus saniviri JCM 17471 = DSM 24301]
MMNELNVLSELMESPQNGYKLQKTLQIPFDHYRKVSFGVIYPLLNRLEAAGAITLSTSASSPKTKVATITEAGKQRFFELMAEPIPKGAHTDDIYRIKLDAMQHLPLSTQLDLLNDYKLEQESIIRDAKDNIAHLDAVDKTDHWYAAQRINLQIIQAQATLTWIADFQEQLTTNEVSHVTTN